MGVAAAGGIAFPLGLLQAKRRPAWGGEPLSPLRVELRQAGTDRLLEHLELADLGAVPQPGRWFELGSRSFLVLQRHHRYQLRNGRYHLASVALQVKLQRQPSDARWWNHRWVIGDPSCRFNARTPLLRCAVLPEGPCERCSHYAPAGST